MRKPQEIVFASAEFVQKPDEILWQIKDAINRHLAGSTTGVFVFKIKIEPIPEEPDELV